MLQGGVVRSPDSVSTSTEEEDDRLTAATDAAAFWTFGSRVAVLGIFLVMVGGVLIYARPVLLPIVSAVVIGTMFGPLERRATAWGIPSSVFALAVVLVLLVALQGAAVLLSGSIISWIQDAPKYAEALGQKLQIFDRGFAALREVEAALSSGGERSESVMRLDVAAILQAAFTFVTPAMGELLIFFATLFFFLFSRAGLRRNLILVFETQDTRLRIIRVLNDIEAHLTRYLGTVTVINIAVGAAAGIGAQLLGLPNPLLIGVAAFLCNYVPYIGPAFIVLILFAVSLIHYPLFGQALVPPALFVAMTTVEGHIITPNIVGQRLTLNPFAVFLGLTMWTWLWGPIGAFLSVPFLIVALVLVDHFSEKDEVELPG
jgi:predicted PurR-regulated permease PerM